MDESAFDIDQRDVAATSRLFPARRLPVPAAAPLGDLGYLTRPGEFGEHAWDESGHC